MDPPLSIPNREVKRTYADGTDRPVGRVGRRRSWKSLTSSDARDFFYPRTAATLFTEGRSPQTPCVASLRNLVPPTEKRQLPLSVTPKPPLRGLSRFAPKSRSTNRRTAAYRLLFRGSAPNVLLWGPCPQNPRGSLLPYFAAAKYPHRRAR